MKPNFSESIGLNEWIDRMNPNETEFFGFIRIDRIHSDWKFVLILINGRINSNEFGQSEHAIRMNPVIPFNSNFQTEWIRSTWMNSGYQFANW